MDELLDQTEEKEVNHTKAVSLLLLIGAILMISPTIISFTDLILDQNGYLMLMAIFASPFILLVLVLITSFSLFKRNKKTFTNSISLIYTLIPFITQVLLITAILVLEFSVDATLIRSDFKHLSVFLWFSCFPSTIIFCSLKAKKMAINMQRWYIMIPICVILLALELALSYYMIESLVNPY